MSAIAPVGVQTFAGVEMCGCGHPDASHFPACLATIHRTENEWGGGTTTICGCPNFGSSAGIDHGRRTRMFLVRKRVVAALGVAQVKGDKG